MAAEIFERCAAFDSGFALQHLFSEILGLNLPISLYTDSMTAWDTKTTIRNTAERRFLVDIYGLREAFRTGDMHKICAIDTAVNPADAMTNVKPTPY